MKWKNKPVWIWSCKGCGKTLIDRGVIQSPVNSSLYLNAKYSAVIGIWGSSSQGKAPWGGFHVG